MAQYTVTLSEEHEDAVSYALEQIAAQAEGSDPPLQIPSRQAVVEQALRGGLAVPYSELVQKGDHIVPLLQPMAAALRAAVLAELPSAALRQYVARHLGPEGAP